MDINMPLMDGATAAKLIKESNPNLIIIAQTAFSDMDDTIIAKKYNCDEILYKPISLKNLYDLIRKYL
jgi:CheY-like chemotaxis protein